MEVEGHHLHWCTNKEILVLSLANHINLIDAFSFFRKKKAEILSINLMLPALENIMFKVRKNLFLLRIIELWLQ